MCITSVLFRSRGVFVYAIEIFCVYCIVYTRSDSNKNVYYIILKARTMGDRVEKKFHKKFEIELKGY